MAAMPSAVEDLKDEQVPACLYWSVDQVADWIEELGFPNYKECFKQNVIEVVREYLALEGGPPIFKQRFTCAALLNFT